MSQNKYPIQIKKRLALETVRFILGAFPVLVFIFIFYMYSEKLDNLMLILFVFISVVIFIFRMLYLGFYLSFIEYSLEIKNLVFKGGIISRFEKNVPYSKIQHVIIYESLLQRFFGLASISLETAREGGVNPNLTYTGSQMSGVVSTGPFISDLKKEDAEALKNQIIILSNKSKSVAGI